MRCFMWVKRDSVPGPCSSVSVWAREGVGFALSKKPQPTVGSQVHLFLFHVFYPPSIHLFLPAVICGFSVFLSYIFISLPIKCHTFKSAGHPTVATSLTALVAGQASPALFDLRNIFPNRPHSPTNNVSAIKTWTFSHCFEPCPRRDFQEKGFNSCPTLAPPT